MWCNTIRNVDIDRNHDLRVCPRYDEAQRWIQKQTGKHWGYTLPPFVTGNSPIEVSRDCYMKVYDIKWKRVRSIQKMRTMQDPNEAVSKTGKHGNQKQLSQEDKGRLMEVMIYNLAKSGDHYVSFDSASKIQSFGPNVTKVSLWWEFCQAYDPEFVAQSHRLGYRHGRDRKELCPSPEKFAEDEAGKQIFPRVGLRTASNFFALHKVRFGKLRVDVCEECERFRFELLTAQGDKRKRLLEALRKHLEEAVRLALGEEAHEVNFLFFAAAR